MLGGLLGMTRESSCSPTLSWHLPTFLASLGWGRDFTLHLPPKLPYPQRFSLCLTTSSRKLPLAMSTYISQSPILNMTSHLDNLQPPPHQPSVPTRLASTKPSHLE